MIGILGAMREEVAALVEASGKKHLEPGVLAEYNIGTIAEKEVVIAKSGVGKVLSSLTAAEMINRYKPECLIFAGIAGGIKEGLKIGDLVVGTDCLQYDMDVTGLGYPLGSIPFTACREVPGDPDLLNLMASYRPKDYAIHFGRILTGDTFVTDGDSPVRQKIFTELEGTVVEMEGAAVALAAQVYSVPVLVMRFVSDVADGKAPENFQEFLAVASNHLVQVVSYLLKKIPAKEN